MGRNSNEPQKCKTCGGRGRWQEQRRFKDGTTELIWLECITCLGSGIQPDSGAEDTYDIGGDSLDED